MSEWGWIAVVGGGLTAGVFGILMLAIRRRPAPPALVADVGDSRHELLLGDMTDVLARGAPGETRDRAEILPELARAGFYSPTALSEYRAVRTVLVLVPLVFAAAVAALLEPQHMVYAVLGGVLVAALGFSLPRLYVTLRAADRSREIERGLPVFADMLSIALLAGQGLTGALRQVTAQLRNAFPRMAGELEIVMRQTDMLSLNVAFEQWANRCQLAEVRNLSVILTQSQRLGNDVSTALMEFATTLRSEARQRADAKAQRASFWMLFPTILCLWLPAITVLVAPMYYEFIARRVRAKDTTPQIGPDLPGAEHFKFDGKK